MADRRERHVVELRVDAAQFARQIDSMDKNLSNLNRTATNVQRSFSGFTRGLSGLATLGVGFYQLTQVFDRLSAIQTVNNQLKTVASSVGELNTMQTALLETANEARASYEATVTLYTRLTRATETLGLSQQELLQITENVAKGLAIGGANAKETASSMYQLSQAFASNRLAGDEFRSLSENFPQLMQILSKHLNITIGDLKKLGSEGKLTGQVLSDALLGATAVIDEKFSKTTVTLGQSLTVLNNQLDMIILNFEESTGILADVAAVMVDLAKNTRLVEAALLGLSTLVSVTLVAGLVALAAAIGPVGIAVVALSAAVGAAYYYWDDILDIWHDVYAFMRYDMVAGLKTFALDMEETFEKFGIIYDEFMNDVIEMWNTFKKYTVDAINIAIQAYNQMAASMGMATIALIEVNETAKNHVDSMTELEAKYAGLRQGVSQWALDAEAAYRTQISLQKDLDRELDRFRAKLPGLSDKKGTPTAPAAAAGLSKEAQRALDHYNDWEAKIQFAIDQELFERPFKEAEEAAKLATQAMEDQAEAIERLLSDYQEGYASQKQYTDGQAVLNQALIDGVITLEQYRNLLNQLKLDTGVNLTQTQSLWLEYGDVVKGVFDDIAASLADFAVEGSGSIKDMLKDWEKALLQFSLSSAFDAVQEAFKKMAGASTTSAIGGGGFFDSLFNFGYNVASAKGNVFDRGRVMAMKKGGLVKKPAVMRMANGGVATVAEEGTEAIMPLQRGPDGKLGVAASGAGTTIVNVNNNVPGAVATATEFSGPGGEKVIEVMVNKAVAKGFGTGAFDKSMKANFGLTREGRR